MAALTKSAPGKAPAPVNPETAALPKADPPKAGPSAAPAKASPTDTVVPLGMSANGGIILSSFQPSVAALAIVLGPHLKRNTDISNLFPLPVGLSLKRSDTLQIQLRLAPFFARKLKRVFGYVAEIAYQRRRDQYPSSAASCFAGSVEVRVTTPGEGVQLDACSCRCFHFESMF